MLLHGPLAQSVDAKVLNTLRSGFESQRGYQIQPQENHMKVWQIVFPDEEMLVSGDVTEREAIDIFINTLTQFVKQNTKKVDFEQTGRARKQAGVSQQAEEIG